MKFRETILIVVAVAVTILCACEPVATDRYGFDLPVGPGSAGNNTVTVDFNVSVMHLTGSIRASEGVLSAEVMSPPGAVVFTAIVEAPGEVLINRYLPVEEGEWKMRYLSLNGTGYIRMQLNLIK